MPDTRFGPCDGLCHHAEDHAQFGFAILVFPGSLRDLWTKTPLKIRMTDFTTAVSPAMGYGGGQDRSYSLYAVIPYNEELSDMRCITLAVPPVNWYILNA